MGDERHHHRTTGEILVLMELFFILPAFDVTILVVACSVVVQDGENWVHRISALLFYNCMSVYNYLQ